MPGQSSQASKNRISVKNASVSDGVKQATTNVFSDMPVQAAPSMQRELTVATEQHDDTNQTSPKENGRAVVGDASTAKRQFEDAIKKSGLDASAEVIRQLDEAVKKAESAELIRQIEKAVKNAELLCGFCDEKVEDGNFVRPSVSTVWCKPCNSLKGRAYRINKDMPWQNLSAEKRREWFRENHASFGLELTASLTQLHTEIQETASTVELVGTGDFLDEDDLKERYRSKPEQLECILANTQSFKCARRGVKLYEDMKYTSVRKESTVKTTRDLKTVECTDERKGIKRKTVTTSKPRPSGEPKPVSPAQLKRAEKQVQMLSKELEKLDALMKNITASEHCQHVPPYVLNFAKVTKADTLAHIASLGMLKMPNAVHAGPTLDAHVEVKQKLATALSSLRTQLEQVKLLC